MTPRGKNGGARPGAGRPKGSKNKKTIEQEMFERELRARVMRSKGKLLNSQMNLAQGVSYLYRIDTLTDSKGKKYKTKPELVTSQEEIEAYLAGEVDDESSYYYITTEKPDNKAIDSLFDRSFGKAVQRQEISGPDGGPIESNNPQAEALASKYEEEMRKLAMGK